jgi:hypothetical protein
VGEIKNESLFNLSHLHILTTGGIMAKLESYYSQDTSILFAFLGLFGALICGALAWGEFTGIVLYLWLTLVLVLGPLIAGFIAGYAMLYRKQTYIPMLWSALPLAAGLLIGNYMGALWLVRHAHDTSTSGVMVSAAIYIAVALAVGLAGSYFGYLRRGKKDYDHRMGLLPEPDAEPPTLSE